jgi:hypothetical protein
MTGDPPILLSIQKKWPRILARLDRIQMSEAKLLKRTNSDLGAEKAACDIKNPG